MPKKKKTKTKTAPTTTAAQAVALKRSKVFGKYSADRRRSWHVRSKLGGDVVTDELDHPTVTTYKKLRARAKSADKAVARKQQKELTLASEAMGETGGMTYLKAITGSTLTIAPATKTTPFARTFTAPWKVVVAFSASGVADLVHWDGATLHVIEAKGGSSSLSVGRLGRVQKYDHVTEKRFTPQEKEDMRKKGNHQMDQGSLRYLTDIALQMKNSPSTDGRAAVGAEILRAIKGKYIEYVPIGTSLAEGHDVAQVKVIAFDEGEV